MHGQCLAMAENRGRVLDQFYAQEDGKFQFGPRFTLITPGSFVPLRELVSNLGLSY